MPLSRRDFLKGFTALASGLVLAPAKALADITRIGPVEAWVEPVREFTLGFYVTREILLDNQYGLAEKLIWDLGKNTALGWREPVYHLDMDAVFVPGEPPPDIQDGIITPVVYHPSDWRGFYGVPLT
jgi:hypothetical protein